MPASNAVDRPLINIDRIPRFLLLVALIAGCILTGSLGMTARRPFMLAAQTRAENERLAERYANLKYETQRLEGRVAEYQSPEGREREARSRGYLKPNETRITFLP